MMTLARDTDSGEWKYVQSPQAAPCPEGKGRRREAPWGGGVSANTAQSDSFRDRGWDVLGKQFNPRCIERGGVPPPPWAAILHRYSVRGCIHIITVVPFPVHDLAIATHCPLRVVVSPGGRAGRLHANRPEKGGGFIPRLVYSTASINPFRGPFTT